MVGMTRTESGRLSLGALLFAAMPFATSGAQEMKSPAVELAECRAEKAALRTGMTAVFADFDAATVPLPVPLLVALDGRIRALLRDRPSYRPCESDRDLIHDPRWERMGVAPGYWGDLAYSGQLLLEAHRRDPLSPQRAYSLYSTVFGEQAEGELAVMPDISAAFAYAQEFPGGPFIRDVYLTIAHFHKDLFMVLRDRHADFLFDCYAAHISGEPWVTQQARARNVSADYYRRVLVLDPGDDAVKRLLDETERGVVRQWSFCAD